MKSIRDKSHNELDSQSEGHKAKVERIQKSLSDQITQIKDEYQV